MRNYWLVARHEYRRTVLRRAFVLLTLAIPIAFAALITLAVVVELASENRLPVGYVDHAGFLEESRQHTLSDPEDRIEVRAFADEKRPGPPWSAKRFRPFLSSRPGTPPAWRPSFTTGPTPKQQRLGRFRRLHARQSAGQLP